MITAFQANAFQNNAFQIAVVPPTPILIDDTHDGVPRKLLDDEYRLKKHLRKESIIDAFERLIEGKVDLDEFIEEFGVGGKNRAKYAVVTNIDFDKLLQHADKVEKLWQTYIDMDDEDVLVLM
jgi:hypothetical protein